MDHRTQYVHTSATQVYTLPNLNKRLKKLVFLETFPLCLSLVPREGVSVVRSSLSGDVCVDTALDSSSLSFHALTNHIKTAAPKYIKSVKSCTPR